MDKYQKYINKSVQVRYIKKMSFYKRKINASGNDVFMDVMEDVPNSITGMVWGITPTKLILMSFEDDSETYIPLESIKSIKEIK